ncbi:hypothetical protein GCM10023339_78580 [Alloalcanivorax gelatiniphagus]
MTLKQKAPAPDAAGSEGQGLYKLPPKHPTIGPRHRRLLEALLSGPITREQADSIARASNSPHWIMELRHRGLVIQCQRRKRRDSDGNWIRPGVYSLARESIPSARRLLEGAPHE